MNIISIVDTYYENPPINQMPHYVFGRILTHTDLLEDRKVTLQRLGHLARATGSGIAEGLWVEADGDKTLTISTGIGINKAGHPVIISEASGVVELTLPPEIPQELILQTNPSFAPCMSEEDNNENLREIMKDGPYLLTAMPVYRLSDEMIGIERKIIRKDKEFCANRWQEEGIMFRLVYLGFPDVPEGYDTTIPSEKRRNLLAHWVYGTENMPNDRFSPFSDWGELDYSGFDRSGLYSKPDANNKEDKRLVDCDLPLAVLYWEDEKIQFVDNWAVRRRLARKSNVYASSSYNTVQNSYFPGWGQQLSDQVAAEGEARFMQFQNQLESLLGANSGSLQAKTNFRFLPPAAYVPIRVSDALTQFLASYMVDYLLEEMRQYISYPLKSYAFFNVPTIVPMGPNLTGDHIDDYQMDDLIRQINSVFAKILVAHNKLAVLNQRSQINIQPIAYVKPFDPDAQTNEGREVDSNLHVLSSAWNNRILPIINDNILKLTNAINELSYNKPNLPLIIIGQTSGASDNPAHLDVGNLLLHSLNSLNSAISQFANVLNLVGSDPSFAQNPFFSTIRSNLITQLNAGAKFPGNGVTIENFFIRDNTNNHIKSINFVDRQTINRMLESSWHDPAIDLNKGEALTLNLVYEDVIPHIAGSLLSVLQGHQNYLGFGYDSLYMIWYTRLIAKFQEIVATRTDNNRPPLYGLFTRMVHPPQSASWAQRSGFGLLERLTTTRRLFLNDPPQITDF